MSARQRVRLRSCILLGFACLLFVLMLCSDFDAPRSPGPGLYSAASADSPQRISDHKNLLLTDAQCRDAFPGFDGEIDEAKALGPFDLPFKERRVVLQAKIENDELYIISAPGKGDLSATMLHRQSATIHQLYRAIKTSPEPLPNTSFAFGTQDRPVDASLSFARPIISPSRKRIFPMPHFSFWSWPLPFINSLPAAARAITALEDALPFAEKDPRPVWRGTTWFNNGAGSRPRLRQDLVAAAAGSPWADVQALKWETNSREARNALPIQDFCRYRYVIHTEGIGYSGRLQFHQLCESVVLSPPLEWMQHTTHLIRPVFSSTLLGRAGTSRYPSAYERKGWPREYPLEEANMVFVASDWSDLEETVRWLEDHQDVAAGIARRQRETYHGGGYLSPAAEVCYWRALLRGWDQVARPVGEKWDQPGVPFEEFVSGREDGH